MILCVGLARNHMDALLTLTINAAEKQVQFLLTQDQTMHYAESFTPKKGGMDLFMSSLQEACRKIDCLPTDIGRIACVVGPGNFMGIRLSLTTVSALSRAISNTVIQAPLDYLQCIACNFHGKDGERIRVITNATTDSVHVNDYEYKDFFPHALGNTRIVSLDDIVSSPDKNISNSISFGDIVPDYIVGSGVRTHFDSISKHAVNILPSHFDAPTSHSLWRMTMHATWQTADIIPMYLKECDALKSFDHISSLLGNDPHEAREKLHRIMTQTEL